MHNCTTDLLTFVYGICGLRDNGYAHYPESRSLLEVDSDVFSTAYDALRNIAN